MYFHQANERQDPSDMSDPSEVNPPHHVLFVQGPPGRYVVPWYYVQQPIYPNYPVDPNHPGWIQAAPYAGNAPIINGRQSETDGEVDSNVEDASTGGASFPPPGVGLPPASTMQQQPVYPMMPPFSYVGSIQSGVSMPGFVNSPISYPHPYQAMAPSTDMNTSQNSRGGRGSGKANSGSKMSAEKSSGGGSGNTNNTNNSSNNNNNSTNSNSSNVSNSNDGVSFNAVATLASQDSNTTNEPSTPTLPPAMAAAAPAHAANFLPLQPVQYSYPYFHHQAGPPPPHITSAQHAAGSPLYIPYVAMNPTAPIYSSAPAPVFSADNGMSHTAVNVPVSMPLPSDMNHEAESPAPSYDGVGKDAGPVSEDAYKNSNLLVDSVPFEPAESQKSGNASFVQPNVSKNSAENTIVNVSFNSSQSIPNDVAAEKDNANDNFHEIVNSGEAGPAVVKPTLEKVEHPTETKVDNVIFKMNELGVNENNAETNHDDKVPNMSSLEINQTTISRTVENGNDADVVTSEMGTNESKSTSPESVNGQSCTSESANSSGFESGISKISTSTDSKDETAEENTQSQGATKTWASLFKGSSSSSKSKASTNTSTRSSMEPSNNVTSSFSNQNADHLSNSNVSDNTSSVNDVSSTQSHYKTHNYKYSSMSSASLADDTTLPKIGELLKNYKLDHRAVNFEPRGLENRSNYCYVNAILQALLACPPFYNLMKCISHNLHNTKSKLASKQHFPIIDSMVQFVDEFRLISQKARRDKVRKLDAMPHQEIIPGKPFEPNSMYNMLSVIQNNSVFTMGQQEDAQEFLTCLLNGLNDEMVELIQLAEGTNNGVNSRKIVQPVKTTPIKSNKKLSNGDIASEVSAPDDSDSEWKQVHPKIKHRANNLALTRTPLSEIFRGQMRSRLQKIGDSTTNNIEPFFTLHLNIEKASSVKEALELLVGRDALEGVTSSRTNQEVDAWQQQTLEELPYVLLLHLKYFDFKHHTCTKIMKQIEFPIDLKLETKLISNQSALRMKTTTMKSRQYKLFAVVYHDGKEASKGHYITDVFHIGYGGWIRYDDARVCTVSENDVLKPKLPRVPYLLYYRRCDTIAALMQPPFEKRQWW